MAWIIEQSAVGARVPHNKTPPRSSQRVREFFPATPSVLRLVLRLLPAQAYVPQTDLYIPKDSSRNGDIDQLRHAATASLSRRDTIIVASVSCIYGPARRRVKRVVFLNVDEETDRDRAAQAGRHPVLAQRHPARARPVQVKGDVIGFAGAPETAYRVSFFGDLVGQITHFDPLTARASKSRTSRCSRHAVRDVEADNRTRGGGDRHEPRSR
jgi:excinuclease ABC subunit B